MFKKANLVSTLAVSGKTKITYKVLFLLTIAINSLIKPIYSIDPFLINIRQATETAHQQNDNQATQTVASTTSNQSYSNSSDTIQILQDNSQNLDNASDPSPPFSTLSHDTLTNPYGFRPQIFPEGYNPNEPPPGPIHPPIMNIGGNPSVFNPMGNASPTYGGMPFTSYPQGMFFPPGHTEHTFGSMPNQLNPMMYPFDMFGPMGQYGLPFNLDDCWGPCKQAAWEQAMAASATIASPSQSTQADEETNYINASTLDALIKSKVPMTIIDARVGSLDDGKRIPGAKSLSPHPTLEEINKIVPAKDSLIIVYGSNVANDTSKILALHLQNLGFEKVIILRDGINSWITAGYPTESSH